jgi:hypothetical protein
MEKQSREDPQYEMLKSSSELGWRTLLAELRTYRCGEGRPGQVARQAEIFIALEGSGKGISGHRIGENWCTATLRPGLIWLKPAAGKYACQCWRR